MKKIIVFLLLVFSFTPNLFATNYQFVIKNASQPTLFTAGTGVLGENIVYDSVTGKYWWIFTDANPADQPIRIASATTIEGTWTIQAGNVITPAGGDDLYAPHIIKFGSIWYIYYTSTVNKDIRVQTSAAVASGYAGETVVLSPGGSGAWDENRVTEPDVQLINGTYYLLYMGESVAGTFEKIGLATSTDPITGFTKYVSNPVLAGNTTWWDQGTDRAADPIILQKDGTIYVGAAVTNAGKNNWHNYFWTTTDFITYKPLNHNPVLTWFYDDKAVASTWDTTSTHRGDFFQDNNGNWWAPYTGKNNTTYKGGIGRLYLVPESS